MSRGNYYHKEPEVPSQNSTHRKASPEPVAGRLRSAPLIYATDQPRILLDSGQERRSESHTSSALRAESVAPLGKQASGIEGTIMRKPADGSGQHCACGGSVSDEAGECAACQAKQTVVQRSAVAGGQAAPTLPPAVHETLRAPGQPLDPTTRAFMEPRFGQSFGYLRVHNDGKAAESARAINALAYTVGQHIVFGAGQYMPHTMSGKGLLAHELAHVVQQSKGGVAPVQRALSLGAENNAHEREADHAAQQILFGSGRPLVGLTPVNGLIQRTCYQPPLRNVSGCARASGEVRGDSFLFVRGCDDFRTDTARPVAAGRSPGEASALRALAATLNNGDSLEIHGYASEEGDFAYNESLSCLRAQRALWVMSSEARSRGVSLSFQLFMHGELSGLPLADKRKVVINIRRSSPPPPTAPCVPSVVTGRTPALIYTHGRAGTGRDSIHGDFPYAIVAGLPLAQRIAVTASIPRSDVDLLATFLTVIGALGRGEGITAFSVFQSGTGGLVTYGPGTNFSTLAQGAGSVRRLVAAVTSVLNYIFRTQAGSCRIDYTAVRIPSGVFPTISFEAADSVPLKAVIGGTQALWISINSFSSYPGRTYRAVLSLDIYDDFGVDESDLYAPGLLEFYVLQHFRTGYKPFIHRIIVEETITGSY